MRLRGPPGEPRRCSGGSRKPESCRDRPSAGPGSGRPPQGPAQRLDDPGSGSSWKVPTRRSMARTLLDASKTTITRCPPAAADDQLGRVAVGQLAQRQDIGSCRTACCTPWAKLAVSLPTSRWIMVAFWFWCQNWIGCSRLTIRAGRCWLRCASSAARVLILPHRGWPVSRIRPEKPAAPAPPVHPRGPGPPDGDVRAQSQIEAAVSPRSRRLKRKPVPAAAWHRSTSCRSPGSGDGGGSGRASRCRQSPRVIRCSPMGTNES